MQIRDLLMPKIGAAKALVGQVLIQLRCYVYSVHVVKAIDTANSANSHHYGLRQLDLRPLDHIRSALRIDLEKIDPGI